MRRLLFTLLIALLALPATAAPLCAEQPPARESGIAHHAAGHDMADDAPMPDRHAMPDHGCIGCATPMRAPVDTSGLAGWISAALWFSRAQAPIDGLGFLPEIPPPRAAA